MLSSLQFVPPPKTFLLIYILFRSSPWKAGAIPVPSDSNITCKRLNEAWLALEFIRGTDSLVFVPERSMHVFVSSKLPDLKSSCYSSSSVVTLEDHGALVTCLSVDRDGNLIISGDENGVVCVRWSKGEDLFLSVVLKAHAGPVMAMKLSNTANHFITGGIDGSARLWKSLQDEERVISLCELHVGSGLICSLALSERNCVVGTSDGTVYIFGGMEVGEEEQEVHTPSLLVKFQHTRWPITMISSFIGLEPTAVWATADDKGTIMLYNVLNCERGRKGEWIPIAEHNLGAPPTVLDFLEPRNIASPLLLTCTHDSSTMRIWKTNELPLGDPLPLLSPPQPVVQRTTAAAAAYSSVHAAHRDHGEHDDHGLLRTEDVESDNIPSPMSSRPSLQNNNAALDEGLLPLPSPPQPVVRTGVGFSVQVASSDHGEHGKPARHGLYTEDAESSSCNVAANPPPTSRYNSLQNNAAAAFHVEGTGRNPSKNSPHVVAPPQLSSLCNPTIHSSARLTTTQGRKMYCSQSDAVYTDENYKNIATASVNVDRDDVLYPNLTPIEKPTADVERHMNRSTPHLHSSSKVAVVERRPVVHLEPTDRTFMNVQPPTIAESFTTLAKFADPPFRDEYNNSCGQDGDHHGYIEQ